jgi:hypothetical protein
VPAATAPNEARSTDRRRIIVMTSFPIHAVHRTRRVSLWLLHHCGGSYEYGSSYEFQLRSGLKCDPPLGT